MPRIRVRQTPALLELERPGRCLWMRERGLGPLWYYEAVVRTGPGVEPAARRVYTVVAETDKLAADQAFKLFSEEVDYDDIQ